MSLYSEPKLGGQREEQDMMGHLFQSVAYTASQRVKQTEANARSMCWAFETSSDEVEEDLAYHQNQQLEMGFNPHAMHYSFVDSSASNNCDSRGPYPEAMSTRVEPRDPMDTLPAAQPTHQPIQDDVVRATVQQQDVATPQGHQLQLSKQPRIADGVLHTPAPAALASQHAAEPAQPFGGCSELMRPKHHETTTDFHLQPLPACLVFNFQMVHTMRRRVEHLHRLLRPGLAVFTAHARQQRPRRGI